MKLNRLQARWHAFAGLSVVALAFAFLPMARAGCDLQIASAGPCLANGSTGIPHVGEAYSLKATVNVKGATTHPFRIQWTLANVTNYFNNISLGPGNSYGWRLVWWVNLDDPVPWSVTLDPDGVSGDTNLVNNTASGTFTPVPPTTAVENYASRLMHGTETATLSFQPGSGTIGNLWVLFGVPTSHGAQQVVSITAPRNAQTIITSPCGVPVYEVGRTNTPAGTFRDTNTFVVQLSNLRVNPTLLRTGTWAEMSSLTTNWTQWLAPDPTCQSSDAVIASFVQQSLPANYRSSLTPYDTARTLHRAIMRKLTYLWPPLHGDAVNVLQDGVADCGGFSSLLTACLRNAGIPARLISGFWQGDSQWHARVEFHLPGVEWLVADPTLGQGADPTGTYAYEFGYVPDANQFLAVDVGSAHLLLNNNFGAIQVPNWWWTGGATFNSYAATYCLQPNGVLSLTNASPGTLSFYFTDVPTQGAVVMQSSTDLANWSPVSTNPANANALYYSFPNANGPRRFYRAQLIP